MPSFRARLAAIVAGAVALRLLYVLVLARHVPMAGDSQFFNAEANLVADGKGYVEPFVEAAYGLKVPTAAHPRSTPRSLPGCRCSASTACSPTARWARSSAA